ncbi:hypothetical protein L1987_15441 [Smallanthus sonchifolius]|uniref:Uncharacterized protein n=1 Tax=Smallanthus sonchifolius TaxID=185202 RepID=A0ACB9J630_9ASTR|nr:hypothetical protein L1987_15441 [Smallanthus sonchifolius]
MTYNRPTVVGRNSPVYPKSLCHHESVTLHEPSATAGAIVAARTPNVDTVKLTISHHRNAHLPELPLPSSELTTVVAKLPVKPTIIPIAPFRLA